MVNAILFLGCFVNAILFYDKKGRFQQQFLLWSQFSVKRK